MPRRCHVLKRHLHSLHTLSFPVYADSHGWWTARMRQLRVGELWPVQPASALEQPLGCPVLYCVLYAGAPITAAAASESQLCSSRRVLRFRIRCPPPVRYRIGNRASKGLYAHSTYRVSRRVIIYYGVSPRPAYSVILELGFSPSRIGIPSRNSFETRRSPGVRVSVTVSVPVQRRRLGAPSAASRAVRGFRSRSGPASSAARVGRGATERFRAVSVPRTGATRTRATRYGRARGCDMRGQRDASNATFTAYDLPTLPRARPRLPARGTVAY